MNQPMGGVARDSGPRIGLRRTQSAWHRETGCLLYSSFGQSSCNDDAHFLTNATAATSRLEWLHGCLNPELLQIFRLMRLTFVI
jgi:hypothetical protein